MIKDHVNSTVWTQALNKSCKPYAVRYYRKQHLQTCRGKERLNLCVACILTCTQFRVMHVLVWWEKAGVPGVNPADKRHPADPGTLSPLVLGVLWL